MNEYLLVGAMLLAFGTSVYGYIKSRKNREVIESVTRQIREANVELEGYIESGHQIDLDRTRKAIDNVLECWQQQRPASVDDLLPLLAASRLLVEILGNRDRPKPPDSGIRHE